MNSTATGHFFSVDVEEYFQVQALESVVGREAWDRHPSRVEASTDRILALLAEREMTGTFFTLGWIAERFPQLVRRIVAGGHEVASHGYLHRRITTLSPDEFRDDVRRARAQLEQVAGTEVVGFRAPSFSIVPGMEWAFEILVEEGYRYDSSVFPIRRPGYGYPGAPGRPYVISTPAGPLNEFPLATLRVAGLRLPAAGGAYLRLLPYALCAAALRQSAGRGEPAMTYVHPWEIDDGQPRLDVSPMTHLRHYGGLAGMEGRLQRLLRDFRFQSVKAWEAGGGWATLP